MIDQELLKDDDKAVEKAWGVLIKEIGDGREFSTVSLQKNHVGKRFLARYDGEHNHIIIEPTGSKNSVELKTPRLITKKDVKCVLKYYPDYIRRIKGIREKMSKCSLNTSYVLPLVHDILDK